jgi:hypothetical protein
LAGAGPTDDVEDAVGVSIDEGGLLWQDACEAVTKCLAIQAVASVSKVHGGIPESSGKVDRGRTQAHGRANR